MIIKYIITDHNQSLAELRSFAAHVKAYGLEQCHFQVSFDFKKELVDADALMAAVGLFTYLLDVQARFVFLDDLLWQRVSGTLNQHYAKVVERIAALGLSRGFADRKDFKKIIIWGAGVQAKFLLEKSAFLREVGIECLVDDAPEKVNKDFYGHRVLSSRVLMESDTPVLIAAVQNVPQILANFYKLGLPESRLIKSLVI